MLLKTGVTTIDIMDVTMPRVARPLNNTQINNAKPKDKEYNLSDGDGLLLRIKTNGSKQWLFNYYHPHTKKRKNISIGTYPDISLAKARAKRGEFKQLLAENIDPKTERENASKQLEQVYASTLEHVAKQWFEVKKTTVTDSYATDVWRL